MINNELIISKLIKHVNIIADNNCFKNLGKTNIRSTATAILNASSIEEIKLYIFYKSSKKDSGWDNTIKVENKEKKLGEYINCVIDEIYKDCNGDEKQTIKYAAKFLGYLYWRLYGVIK